MKSFTHAIQEPIRRSRRIQQSGEQREVSKLVYQYQVQEQFISFASLNSLDEFSHW
jgi:hypothetical protein